ncbi:hypothetical protein H8356DRAFT_1394320 [Neocallimastix lanati (nom. inval.)]|uniref:Uncharacterized protein n=1 Tax=Neocallimastix californiae TaxID=1754190 RepID=A0A1Y1ZWD6_9FUNG|nr:hypothetical protein H8356DRAFT_1394320 [Neocallimastix sp. JGI-2020a]ORY14490.1 hypothetical protein LY90DRAFT_518036 [Neocallimastix californiae]|eukprot:ORY14490.1 hypothetical protein LY90DRAFT_518036 [Neocallimastix californiae]
MTKHNTDVNNKEQLFGVIFENKDFLKYTIRFGVENTEQLEINEEANDFESYIKYYTWRLPLYSLDHFALLLNELDRLISSAINRYVLSLTTLEELFNSLEDNITFN